jgi:hypothetical protein
LRGFAEEGWAKLLQIAKFSEEVCFSRVYDCRLISSQLPPYEIADVRVSCNFLLLNVPGSIYESRLCEPFRLGNKQSCNRCTNMISTHSLLQRVPAVARLTQPYNISVL